ncbi:MAG TPA: tetratricopeptide repeat protein [Candidatus Obscuribacterales bacterium]
MISTRSHYFPVIFLALVGILGRAACAEDSAYDRAVRLQMQGRLREALCAYNKALKLAPNSDAIWYGLGTCLEMQLDYKGAQEAYVKAVALNPENTEPKGSLKALELFNRGVSLQQHGRLQDAAMKYKQALSVKPQAAHLWYALGTVCEAMHESWLPVEYYERAANLNPAQKAYKQIAKAARKFYEERTCDWSMTVAAPSVVNLEPLNRFAQFLQNRGSYLQAELCYEHALDIGQSVLGPKHPQIAATCANYAAFLRQFNRNEEADRLEQRAKAIQAKSQQQAQPL